jgi:hypothetical protein
MTGSDPDHTMARLVGGHPAGRHLGVQRALQHHPGQLGLAREPDLVGDTSGVAALGVSQPSLGQVQLPVDLAMPSVGGSDRALTDTPVSSKGSRESLARQVRGPVRAE